VGTGALALISGFKSILAETADVFCDWRGSSEYRLKLSMALIFSPPAGWAKDRKDGHAYFFPGKFSDRQASIMKIWKRKDTKGYGQML